MNVDDEIRDVHSLACPIWQSPDPTDKCNCGADFQAGVQEQVDRFESYAGRPA